MILRISSTVRQALSSGQPVVALESTVITHGLPQPDNLELAQRLENTVRSAGAVPATIGVISGQVVVGLAPKDLVRLAGRDAEKASLWNLATLVSGGGDAGTTVAATLQIAHLAGIRVFSTGGIGGIHHHPFDESADLAALARFPVLTVCAGPKSILDAAATLERLESFGIPTVGYRSSYLAGFHLSETDLPLSARLDSPQALARAFANHRLLGGAGFLVSNPVSQGLTRADLGSYLDAARRAATAAGVRGKDATPFLLARLAELSKGRTVEVNLRLLVENAALAAGIASALTELEGADAPPVGATHE